MDLLNFINTYWPVLTGVGGFIAWLVGLQFKVMWQQRQIKTLFDLYNGTDRREG